MQRIQSYLESDVSEPTETENAYVPPSKPSNEAPPKLRNLEMRQPPSRFAVLAYIPAGMIGFLMRCGFPRTRRNICSNNGLTQRGFDRTLYAKRGFLNAYIPLEKTAT